MNPHWNLQVGIGQGRQDTGAQHRAIDVAGQLLAVGKWPDHQTTRIIIHNPYDLHRQLQLSGQPEYNAQVNINALVLDPWSYGPRTKGKGYKVYSGVHDLVLGEHYETHPLPASFWQMHGLPEPETEGGDETTTAALAQYTTPSQHPYLSVPQHAIIRTVRALPELEALALIRAAYADDDGGWASLDDARLIHDCIMGQE